MKRLFSREICSALLGLVAISLTLLISGCATADPDNLSARPWNSPTGWESGLPSGMMQGH